MEKEEENTMNKNKYFAAIDLGTNSCRLVIADEHKKYAFAEAYSVKLGEGMYEHMKFTPEAFNRGVDCFVKLKSIMQKYNIIKTRAIATASCRMAQNSQEFIDEVKKKTGIKIEVIDAYEEARLNLKGALEHVCGKTEYVVLYDLGGGSTEITLATNTKNPKILHTISIPWGARNASEAFDLIEYDEDKAQKLQNEIKKYAQSFVKDANLEQIEDKVCFVATSSTPLRYVSMIEKFGKYDRDKADGHVISCKDIDEQINGVYNLTREQMMENLYIGQKRSTIFTSACVIFKTIYDCLGAKEITASLKSAKDGIVSELIEKYKQNKEKNGKVNQICQRNSRSASTDRSR